MDINGVVEETVGFLQADLDRNKVRVKIKLKTGLPKVPADRVQVQQVLLNLLANAADALKSYLEPDRLISIRTTVKAN